MFNVGPAELMVILVVALLVLGPQKLPDAARQVGKAMAEFRRVTSGLQDEVRGVLNDHLDEAPPVNPPPAVIDVEPTSSNGGAPSNGAPESDDSPSTPTPPFLLE